ncbi:MAG: class I tRNA ligase family protein, partial [Candidatus Cloacimonetes bacterium]|nr:class I tRNA ligase family protein [Candidatus Cloacimonadota bacterium]
PFIPFLSEEVYQQLTINNHQFVSVHLEDWPKINESLIDKELERQMEIAREIVEKGHAARKEAGIAVRQPLQKCRVQSSKFKVNEGEFIQLIKDELNVKEIEFTKGRAAEIEVTLDSKLTPALIREGITRELIRAVQDLRKEAKYNLDDEITIYWQTDSADIKKAINEFADEIERKTLGELVEGKADTTDVEGKAKIANSEIYIALKILNSKS